MSHVLEHIVSPRKLLIELSNYLHDDGFVYIEVPSLEGLKKGSYNFNLNSFFHIAHVSHFSHLNLCNLVTSSGFQVVNSNERISMIVEKKDSKNYEINDYYSETKKLLSEIEYSSKLFLNIFVIFKNNLYKIITNLLHKANFFTLLRNLHYLKNKYL